MPKISSSGPPNADAPMFSFSDHPARISPSPASASDWMATAATWRSSPLALLQSYGPAGWSSRTSPVFCPLTAEAQQRSVRFEKVPSEPEPIVSKTVTLPPSSPSFGNAGILGATEFLTLNLPEYPQRRRRVFFVGYLGDWRPAAAVLFEPESLRGDHPPSRKAGQGIAGTISARTEGGGGLGTDFDLSGGLTAAQPAAFNNQGHGWWDQSDTTQTIRKGDLGGGGGARESTLVAFGGNRTGGDLDVATAVNAKGGAGRMDFESETFVAYRSTGNDGTTKTGDKIGALTNNRDPNGTFVVAETLPAFLHVNKGRPAGRKSRHTEMVTVETETVPTLNTDGHAQSAIAFSCKDGGGDATTDQSPTLRAMEFDGSHANGGGQIAVAIPILEAGARTGKSTTDPRAGLGDAQAGDPMYTLQSGKQHAVAFQTRVARNGRGSGTDVVPALNGADAGATSDMRPCVAVFKPSHYTRNKDGAPSGGETPLGAEPDKGDQDAVLFTGAAVRRLTPRECERLQAYPDDYTLVKLRGKPAADGPRYKALGNSMCVTEVRWILQRIEAVDAILEAAR